MNFYRSRRLFSYSTILLLTLLFNDKIAADRCIRDRKRILADLVEEGEYLLDFRYREDSPESLLEYVKLLINEKQSTDEIFGQLADSTDFSIIDQIAQRSKEYIENIINSEENGDENPCAEALRLCESDVHVEPDTYFKTKVTDVWNRDDLALMITPLTLTRRDLEYMRSKDSNHHSSANAEQQVQEVDVNSLRPDTTYNNTLRELILRAATLLHCEVKNSHSSETTFQFYMFTFNESGYPRFIVRHTTYQELPLVYISSELLDEGEEDVEIIRDILNLTRHW